MNIASLTAVAFCVAITGCSIQPAGPYNPIADQCEYESDIAIANIRNPIEAGVQKGQLFSRCMQIRNNAK